MIESPLNLAIAKAGSGVALARIVGVTPMAVSYWKARGIPARHVLAVEAATGVSRHDLRPDLYPEQSPTLNANLRPKPAADQSAESAVQASSAGGA